MLYMDRPDPSFILLGVAGTHQWTLDLTGDTSDLEEPLHDVYQLPSVSLLV